MNCITLESNLNDTDMNNITMPANSAENVTNQNDRTETEKTVKTQHLATTFPEDPVTKMEESSELMNGGETVTADIRASIVNSSQNGKGFFLAAGDSTAESKFASDTGADTSEMENSNLRNDKERTSKKRQKNAKKELTPKKVQSGTKKRMDSKERDIGILPEIKRTNSVEYSKNQMTQYLALNPNKHDDKANESLEETEGVRKDMPEDSSASHKYCKKKLKKKKRIVLDDQAKEDHVKDTTNFCKTKDTNESTESHCNVDTEENKLFKQSDEIYPFHSNDSDKCENMEVNSPEHNISGTRKRKIPIEIEQSNEWSVLKYETFQCTSGEENELRGNIFGASTKSFRVKKNPASKRTPITLSASLKNTTTKSDVRDFYAAAEDEDVLDTKLSETINSGLYASSENEHAANMTPKTKKQKKEKPEDAVISVSSPKKKLKKIAVERKKIKLIEISHKGIAGEIELSLPKDSSQEEVSDLSAVEVNENIKKRQKIHKTSTPAENKLIVEICDETSDEHAVATEQSLHKRLKKKKVDDIEEEHHDSNEFPILQTTARTGKSKSKLKPPNKRVISNDESTTLNVSQQNDDEIKSDSVTASYVMHKSAKPRPRNFMCSYCNKGFTCRYNLKIHHSTHTGDALPYPCSHSDCSKSFATPAATRNHEVSAHSGERNYMCRFCGKSFALIYGLRTHSRWCDTRNTLFTCSNCGKQFRIEWKYNAHVVNKKCKDAEHECEFKLCNKRFVDTYRLRRHMMRVHNVPMHIKND